MLKRIFIIGLFTGFGQLYSIFVLKFISPVGNGLPSYQVAQLDTLFFFMINIIAFGLQPVAIRDLALSEDWKKKFRQVQSARITFGLLLISLIAVSAFNKFYLIFVLAPIIAASGEYALYARGASVYGAFISFLRLTIPFSAILVAAHIIPTYTGLVYVLSLMVIHFISILLIGNYLKVQSFSKPSLKSLGLYISSIPLGIVTLSQYIIGLGILLVAPYFFPSEPLGIVFAGLKFYVLYKGVLRIIHQAFVQEMTKEAFCLKVDQLSIMIALLFFLSALFFPDSFIRFFFGSEALSQKIFFQLLGSSAVLYAFYLSMATTALLLKKDRPYVCVSVLAAAFTVISCIILSFYATIALSVGMSLCIGEFVWVCGLIKISSEKRGIMKRFLFLSQQSLFLLVPLLFRIFVGDQTISLISSLGIVSLILLILHHKKFTD